jgi:hypothetical protein
MTTFHILEPEVAGDLGPATVIDSSTQPPTIVKLQYAFNVWLGDDLLTSHPCFIVSERLRTGLEKLNGTGYGFDDVGISTEGSLGGHDVSKWPHFYWLKVIGVAGADDAGLSSDQRLVVSDRFLNVVRQFKIDHCLIRRKPFQKPDS